MTTSSLVGQTHRRTTLVSSWSGCDPHLPRRSSLICSQRCSAQVKLGRRDARLFIDLCAQALEYAGRYLSEELVKQVETALGQLRLAQVSAENEVAKGEPEPNDLSRIPTPPAVGNRVEADPGHQSASPSSKLWVPGR